MKYVKTFENFNYDTTNENWLWGEGNIWSKIGNWIIDWKNRKLAEGAKIVAEWAKNNPEKIEELKAKTKPIFDKISEEEKKKVVDTLANFQGDIPAEVLNESSATDGTLAKRVAKFFGWTLTIVPALTWIISMVLGGLGIISTGSLILISICAIIVIMPAMALGYELLKYSGMNMGPDYYYGGGSGSDTMINSHF